MKIKDPSNASLRATETPVRWHTLHNVLTNRRLGRHELAQKKHPESQRQDNDYYCFTAPLGHFSLGYYG